jgi:hypothetical protein
MSAYLPANLLASFSKITAPSRSTHPFTFFGAEASKEGSDYYTCSSGHNSGSSTPSRGRAKTLQNTLSRSMSSLERELEIVRLQREVIEAQLKLSILIHQKEAQKLEFQTQLLHLKANLADAKHILETRAASAERDNAERADKTAAHKANIALAELKKLKAELRKERITAKRTKRSGPPPSSSSSSDTDEDTQKKLAKLKTKNDCREEKRRRVTLDRMEDIDKRPACGT